MNLEEMYNLLFSKYDVSRETFQQICKFHEMLVKWNKIVHLTSNNEIEHLWDRHILDSCRILQYLDICQDKVLVDFGSGTGFPGIILALVGSFKEVHLIESNQKKAIFLDEASRICKNKVFVHSERIEKLENFKADIITARAFADITLLLEYSLMHSKSDTKIYSFKGKKLDEEIDNAKIKWDFDYNKFSSDIINDSFIVEITNIRQKNA